MWQVFESLREETDIGRVINGTKSGTEIEDDIRKLEAGEEYDLLKPHKLSLESQELQKICVSEGPDSLIQSG